MTLEQVLEEFGLSERQAKVYLAALELGAGRRTKEDKIDPKAGIIFNSKIGNQINKGNVIAEVFTDNKTKLELAHNKILNSLIISDIKTTKLKIIKKIIY